MADNILETKIQLRYDTYSQWMNSNLILRQGEAAICAFPEERVIDQLSNTTPTNTPPAIGIKIGDGLHYFRELPWVQAVAADVYRWAKSSVKPTYTASEISGLQSFIEDNFHISGDITIAPRIYQITQGTGADSHKYYLRYKENNEESEWVTDTNNAIDLTIYNDIYDWIGQSAIDTYMTLGDFISYLATRKINNLNYTDNPQTHKFVTEVSEVKGLIEVSRAQPNFSDISGTLGVSGGGTGANTLPIGEVLIGNGTNPISTLQIAESVANNDYLVPNRLMKSYVETATAGLAGAMHFIGEATVVITNHSSVDPQIQEYSFANIAPGDVVLYGAQEYVWDGAQWILLGDEGSYAVKGSIKDIDISEDAQISQSKIADLDTALNNKVDKVEGKTLSSNDFTNELKQKLEDIGVNAETNVIEHIMLNGVEVPPQTIGQITKVVNLEVQEFDNNSQTKLANIEAEAQVNKVESIIVNGSEYTPNNEKQIEIQIDQAALNLNVLEGARVPSLTSGQFEDIDITTNPKKLDLSRVSKTGLISDLLQASDTYLILNCGSSTTVI